MQIIGKTESGYTVMAINPGEPSPMQNHLGGEIAVDEIQKVMYAWGIFVHCYGTDSIMRACSSYR